MLVMNFKQRRQHANAQALPDTPRPDATLSITLMKQLEDFRARRWTNDAGVMRRIAQSLTDADIGDLGNYFAGFRYAPASAVSRPSAPGSPFSR
jgi:cytochrome c553